MALDLQGIIDEATQGSEGGQSTLPETTNQSTVAGDITSPFSSSQTKVDNTVTSDQLESSPSVALPEPFVPERISVSEPVAPQPAGPTAAELNRDNLGKESDLLRGDVKDAMDNVADIGSFQADAAEDIGLQKLREAKTEIDNKIARKSRDFDLALRDAQDTFGTRAQKSAIKAEITKEYNRELADLSIIQMARAGEYNDAKAFVDEKVRLELQGRQAQLDGLKFLYEENKEMFSTADQRLFEQQIKKEERAYAEERSEVETFENFRLGLIQAAIDMGAGNAALNALQKAKTMDELLKQDMRMFGPQLGAGTAGFKAPTVKSINGVDHQWDPINGQWIELSGGGPTDYSKAKVTETRSTVSELLSQAMATPEIFGRSAALPIPTFARSDAFRNYSGQLDTLKANIAFRELTAMREASKTGGALGQVSERELGLLENSLGALKMNQTPTQVQRELKNIDASLARWQSAVDQYGGQTTQGTIVTAPNGEQIEIID